MAYNQLPVPDPMIMSGHIYENWKYFRNAYEDYELATELDQKSSNIRLATLRTCMGKDCAQVYRNLPLTEEERNNIKSTLDKLEEYFKPQINTVYERYIFNACKQGHSTADEYIHLLRKYAATCSYGDMTDELIRDRIVLGVTDDKLRLRMFREPDLTLTKAIHMARVDETNQKQLKEIEGIETVNFSKKISKPHVTKGKGQEFVKPGCDYCGTNHQFGRIFCPAYGQSCNNCSKRNHFSIVCKAPKKFGNQERPQINRPKWKENAIHKVEENSNDSGDEYVYRIEHEIGSIQADGQQWFVNLDMKAILPAHPHQESVTCQLDTGSTCNLMSKKVFRKLTQSENPELLSSNSRLRLYDGTDMNPIGRARIECTYGGYSKQLEFQIVNEGSKPLLSAETCLNLGLIQLKAPVVQNRIHNVLPRHTDNQKVHVTTENIISSYSDVFAGQGLFEDECHLTIDPNVTPVKHTPRRVPVALREEFQALLNKLEAEEVVTKVTEPTDWISSSLLVRKGDKLRLCIDPKDLNKALKRAHHPLPMLEDILPDLQDAKIFSVVDAKNGFWHVKLDEESSFLTTFWTPFGRYRWLRMPFGISPAPEEYQRRQQAALEGLPGIAAVFDDILIIGRGKTMEQAQEDHDNNLIGLLNRARDRNIKLNLKKLRLKLTEVVFVGHLLTSKGLLPDPDKVKAVKEMPRPDGKSTADKVKAMQRFLGFINYLSRFMPKLAEESEPLRRLTDKDSEWIWADQHEEAFRNLKELVINHPILAYYDVNKPVTIQCDSSATGLGAALLQENKPVAYASRTLTPTERNYAPIEKECLAIVFSCDRFEQYIYGRQVHIESDHKPLESIFKKPLISAPKRLQTILLKLQKFDLTVGYKKGTEMFLADTLSRAPLPESKMQNSSNARQDQVDIEHVNAAEFVSLSKQGLSSIRDCTTKDEQLQCLKRTVMNGWPENKREAPAEVTQFWTYRDEITVYKDILYKGERISVPRSLRQEMLSRIHASHQGEQACMRRAREALFWPGMNQEIKDKVSQCNICAESAPMQAREPLMIPEIPTRPWAVIAQDLFSFNGVDHLITVDAFSGFWEVDTLKETTSEALITNTKKHFARYGIPEEIHTDCGPQFTSAAYKNFSTTWEFTHLTSSPYHAQGNGLVEAAVKTAKSLLKKSKRSGRDIWLSVLDWRNTPTEGLDSSPAQRLMARRTRTTVPMKPDLLQQEVQKETTEKLYSKRRKAKRFFDRGTKLLPNLQENQDIRVQPAPIARSTIWKKGSCIREVAPRSWLIEVNGTQYRRNRRFLRMTQEKPTEIPPSKKIGETTAQVDTTRKRDSTGGEENIPTERKSITADTGALKTKSGRQVKPPTRLNL